MESKVTALAATPDPTFGQKPAEHSADVRPSAAGAAQSSDPVDMRLIIEEDEASNSYVYKTVNRLTGEVIQQLPREQVLQLRQQLDYEAGDVVRTKA
jgi:flagellar protein FlaG